MRCEMKYYLWVCLILGIYCVQINGQTTPPDTFKLLHILPEPATTFAVDKLQQVYLVTPSNTLVKYLPDGQEQFRYNDNTQGTLTYVEPTDPFNVLLFYSEFQSVATLDRTMNQRALLLLYSSNLVNTSAVGLARDNNIWAYDQATFTLHKIGPTGETLLRSDDLSAQLSEPPVVTQLVARSNWLYLLSPTQGVFLFDNFGQFHQLLPYTGYEAMQVVEDRIILFKSGELLAHNTKTLQTFVLPSPAAIQKATLVRWYGRRCYLLMPDGKVWVFRLG